jgi:hypothetical protein
MGKFYRPKHDVVEVYPDSTQNLNLTGTAAILAVRMDYNFDENFLAAVLGRSSAAVITDKPVNLNLLQNFRGKITEISYMVGPESDISFAQSLSRLNLPYSAVTYARDDDFLRVKEKFFEIGIVNQLPIYDTKKMPEFTDGVSLHYKSSKRIIHGSTEYKGKYDFFGKAASKSDEFSPCRDIYAEEFQKELDFFFIVKLLT